MDNWILIVAIVLLMLAAGLLRERWRVLRVERWNRGRGFVVRSPMPVGGPQPAAKLASHLTVYGARLWGLVLEGSLDGVTITIGAAFAGVRPVGRGTQGSHRAPKNSW